MQTLINLTNDQTNTLIDLVNDQIRATRVYLRTTPLKRTYLTALTHFRNLKRLLLKQEAEAQRLELLEEQDRDESEETFKFFNVGVREAERRKQIINR